MIKVCDVIVVQPKFNKCIFARMRKKNHINELDVRNENRKHTAIYSTIQTIHMSYEITKDHRMVRFNNIFIIFAFSIHTAVIPGIRLSVFIHEFVVYKYEFVAQFVRIAFFFSLIFVGLPISPSFGRFYFNFF